MPGTESKVDGGCAEGGGSLHLVEVGPPTLLQVDWLFSFHSREQKLNPNFFFSNFSGTPGISQQNPGISHQKSLISLVSRGIPNFLAPTPSCRKPLPHREISGLKSLGLVSFFVPDTQHKEINPSTILSRWQKCRHLRKVRMLSPPGLAWRRGSAALQTTHHRHETWRKDTEHCVT